MTHDTIPPPNEHDTAQAHRWVKLAQSNPDRALAVLSQHIAEARWLRNLMHPTTQETDT